MVAPRESRTGSAMAELAGHLPSVFSSAKSYSVHTEPGMPRVSKPQKVSQMASISLTLVASASTLAGGRPARSKELEEEVDTDEVDGNEVGTDNTSAWRLSLAACKASARQTSDMNALLMAGDGRNSCTSAATVPANWMTSVKPMRTAFTATARRTAPLAAGKHLAMLFSNP